MTFVSPIMVAIGAALVGLPILLHLIMQQKPRPFVFPALRFVQERLSSNQRRLRVRHWILLVLRCVGVFLIALAFAMPSVASNLFGTWLTLGVLGFLAVLTLLVLIATVLVTKPLNKILFGVNAAIFAALVASIGSVYSSSVSGTPNVRLGNDQAPVSAVILIDTSPRMLYETSRELEDGETGTFSRLEEAKELADWLIRELPDDSDVAVVDSSPTEPFFSVDISAAAKRMTALKFSPSAVSLVDRIEEAYDFLESVSDDENKPREIYVFTDMTLQSWKSKRQKQLQAKLAKANELSVYLIDLSVESTTNFQLGDLELSVETIANGGSVNILTQVHRVGPPGERPINLYLDMLDPGKPIRQDGKTVFPEQRMVRSLAKQLDENGTETVGFSIGDLPSGIHHGVLKIDGADPLSIDNSRHFTIEVRKPRRILLLRPEKKDETENVVVSKNVEVVLAPDELKESGQVQFDVTTLDQAKLLETRLNEFDAVFLLDPKPLKPLEWASLAKFVETGGGLAIALGENAKSKFGVDTSFTEDNARKVLGGELREVWTPDLAYLSVRNYGHPVFQKFKPFETDDVWRDFAVYQHWGLDINEESVDTEILAQYSTSKPAVIEKKLGKGTIITLTTPLTEPGQVLGRKRWNDLTTGEWWPTALMIDELANYLVSSKNSRLNYRVGDNVLLREESLDIDEFLLFPPRNEEPSVIAVEEGEIRFRFTDSIGSYRFKPIGDASKRKGFSVNLGQQDTDLTKVTDQVLKSTLGQGRYKTARTREEIIREQSFVREGKKFYPLLITVVAVLLLMEFVFSNRFYRGL